MMACSHEELTPSLQTIHDKDVNVTFSVRIPEMQVASRVFSETPEIKSLKLLVFDKEGYFSYQADATRTFPETSDPVEEIITYSVNLKPTTEKRIIHFIANYTPSSTPYQSEEEMIGNMEITGDKNDVYWQRVVFENGLNGQENNEGSFTFDETTISKLQNVPLVRNYVKITVIETADNFELTGFSIINRPTNSTVAPYIMSGATETSNGSFANYEASFTYKGITSQGYHGSMPKNLGLVTDTETDMVTTESTYIFERRQPKDETVTSILIKGTYKGTSGYYKIDIIDSNHNAYDLLRNFEYKITITDVYATGEDRNVAISGAASNNLTASTIVKNYTNISDGVSRLYVSFTDTTVVNTNEIMLKYKYIPDITNGTSSNGDVTINETDPDNDDIIASLVREESDDTQNNVSTGWRTIKITPQVARATTTHTIRITGTHPTTGELLIRDVNITYANITDMSVSCDPIQVEQLMDEEVDILLNLPEGLLKKYFPLEFKIEAAKLSIYPDANSDYMPLEVGASIVQDKQAAQSYYFVKTVTYQDYTAADNHVIRCNFKTNKDESASMVYVYNKFWGTKSTNFTNIPTTKTIVSIPAARLTLEGNDVGSIYNLPFTVYTNYSANTGYSNPIATNCKFTREEKGMFNRYYIYPLLNDLRLKIPNSIIENNSNIYFVCEDDDYRYAASISATDIVNAQTSDKKLNNFTSTEK